MQHTQPRADAYPLTDRWTAALSAKLIMKIKEDVNIKAGLFPSPGSKPRTATGLKKIRFHVALLDVLFDEGSTQEAAWLASKAIISITDRKQATEKMANKIKSRLAR